MIRGGAGATSTVRRGAHENLAAMCITPGAFVVRLAVGVFHECAIAAPPRARA